MRRAGPQYSLVVLFACLLACLLACAVAGCGGCGGKRAADTALTFENLPDTAGLSAGRPVLESFDAYRMDNGALRVHGKIELPDGARVQVAVKRPNENVSVAMVQMTVQDRQFDSPPIVGEAGPLPVENYRFEIVAQFTSDWQTPAVMRATGNGHALHGPGITRSRMGDAALYLVEDMKR